MQFPPPKGPFSIPTLRPISEWKCNRGDGAEEVPRVLEGSLKVKDDVSHLTGVQIYCPGSQIHGLQWTRDKSFYGIYWGQTPKCCCEQADKGYCGANYDVADTTGGEGEGGLV